jgi:predicted deacylase
MKRKEITFHYEDHSCTIPYYEYEGNTSWKHIIISGGMHGNEINGIMMCHHIKTYLEDNNIESELIGKITIIPILNVFGFQEMMRYIPIDSKDLNRSFWKQYDKTYSEHYADFLIENFFQYADHAIDIHDAGGRSILIPHARIHSCDEHHCDLTIHNMGRRFDSKIIMEREGNSGMLAVYGQDILRKPIMTIEIWGNQVIYKKYFDDTLRGIVNILKGLDYLYWDPILHNTIQHHFSNRIEHITECGWILQLNSELWQEVSKWDIVGTIYYPLQDQYKTIVSEADGFVFSIRAGEQIPKNKDMISIIT